MGGMVRDKNMLHAGYVPGPLSSSQHPVSQGQHHHFADDKWRIREVQSLI